MYMPPLTWIVWPVIYFALSDAKNATVFAISVSSPNRDSGICSNICDFKSSLSASVISETMKPGATALTVIPRDASSRALDFVKPSIPALVAT